MQQQEKTLDEHVELAREELGVYGDLEVPPFFREQSWDLSRLTVSAQAAIDHEHSLTFREAVKHYPWAIFFSIGISTTLVMEGYDTGLISSFFGLPQFRQRFGHQLPDGDYQLSTAWQSAISSMASVGGIFGLLFAGQVVDRIGYRWTMFIGLFWLSASIFLTFFAKNVSMLFAGNMLCGVPWGMFQSVASSYATDVAPLTLRPLMTSYISLCWAMGQFISTGVLRSLLSRQDQWAYKIPFAIQWIWPIPLGLITFFAPESPWWLVRKGRMNTARKALRRLGSNRVTDAQLDNAIALMYLTNEHEKEIEKGTTYLELFRGINLRRTEVAVGAWICQVTCGNWFGGNVTYFMEQAGASAYTAFAFGLGMNAVSCIGTVSSWFLTPRVGRRPMYLWGLIGMLMTLLTVGFMGIPSHATNGIQWASGGVLIVNMLLYFLTVGPVCFTIVPEVPTVRLRNKTVSVARAAYNIVGIGASFLNPAILNPGAWNLKQKGGFIWSAFAILSVVWVYFRLPETKGRTPIELDALFERKVKTRDFKTANVDTTVVADVPVARAQDIITQEKP
ncbi:putative maltose permease [Exophiala viscosa]|uniref:Maltose permease n=1 Tax=Exophiala viscosa TaxID=2486360 RepID=A0AAN6DTJ6_9EURO|nr:putative maltose permease [Exophiala viscosa]KAI1619841.1 putative maltose permease [Exophiala viscosa]